MIEAMHRRLLDLLSMKKTTLIIMSFVFVFSTFSGVLSTSMTAGAVTTSSSKAKDLDWQVKSWWYYNAMIQCMNSVGSWTITNASDVKSGNWFYPGFVLGVNGNSPGGWYVSDDLSMGDDGEMGCAENSNQLTKAALKQWGITGIDAMCGAKILVRQNGTECTGGNGDFTWKDAGKSGAGAKFASYIQDAVFGGTKPVLSNAGEYLLTKGTLFSACISSGAKAYETKPSGSNVYKVVILDSSNNPVVRYYIGKQPDTYKAAYSTNPNQEKTCQQLAGSIDDPNSAIVKAYAAALRSGSSTSPQEGTSKDCGSANQEDCDTSTGSSCSVDGIGWILCPVANAMAGMTDALFEGVKAFMAVQPLKLTPGDNNPLYTAWSVMRSIANVAFVIVFLIIIFSQLTGFGVSNYGVKKLLPRLVVGAILVNVSFFISAIAVDISNIIGASIKSAFDAIAANVTNTVEQPSWTSVTTAVLAGAGTLAGGLTIASIVASGGIWGVLAGVLPLLIGALFALFIAFLVLLARQAIIIILIVLSPVAFVAYLLPNTEGLFKKWRDLFISMLALFPMMALLFGGSFLASVVLRETSSNQNGLIGFFLYIGSFAVQAIPFFITPFLIKLSSGLLGRFAGIINNKNVGPFDRMRKGADRIAKDAQNRGYTRKLLPENRNNKTSFGARRRARIDRRSGGLENAAKLAANQTTTNELAEIGEDGSPSKLAMQMTAGNVEQARLMSLQAKSKLVEEETGEAREAIVEANLSGVQKMELANTGKLEVKNAEGRITAKFDGEATQRAAIQEVFTSGSYAQQAELANKSSTPTAQGGLGEFAQTIAQGVIKNGVGSKDPTFSGKRLDALSQGKFDYNNGAKEAMREGKFTATAFARMNDDGREKVIKIAQDAAANGDRQYLDALQSAAQGIQNSVELKGEIAGNTRALGHIESLAASSSTNTNNGMPPNTPSGSGPSSTGTPNDPGLDIRH